MSLRPLLRLSTISTRCLSTSSVSALNSEALNKWIGSDKSLCLHDALRPEHLSDLYITLPTRDGTRGEPYQPPAKGQNLNYGHHLAFFHPRNPEAILRPDGTDADFCPPEPFTRRMWAGGSIKWHSPLVIGDKVTARSNVSSVEKKGFEKGSPMVFVNQTIEYAKEGASVPSVVEGRSHVYLPQGYTNMQRNIRQVEGLPTTSDFSFKYTPTATTLFRFSALTFNGHHIHLDREYAQKAEGYPERLVHGPLTALMLLETTQFHNRDAKFSSFQYRARNPVVVNSPLTIHGAWTSESSVELWTLDGEGTVGMTGHIDIDRTK